MSRHAIDPVDRAFEHWRGLTIEQQQRLADRQHGWNAAQGLLLEPPKPRKAPAKRQPAAATSEVK